MKKLYWLSVFLFILFIFHHSLMDSTASSGLSQAVSGFILKIIHLTVDPKLFETIIRKLAHFLEFAVLGILVFTAQNNYPLSKKNGIVYALFILIGIIDENLQQFSAGRYCSVIDMLIDSSGYIFGLITGILLLMIINKRRKSHV